MSIVLDHQVGKDDWNVDVQDNQRWEHDEEEDLGDGSQVELLGFGPPRMEQEMVVEPGEKVRGEETAEECQGLSICD
jgi:hypothetical protein